jgi:RNA polymerase sigma-70 factor (ECF subfamily)
MAGLGPLPGHQHSSANFAEAYPLGGTGLPKGRGCKLATGDGWEEFHHYSAASDDKLVIRAQSGDRHAFGELCQRHTASLQRRIFGIVKNGEDAEDALQETLLCAYTHLDTFRMASKFSSWLTSIGINAALMILRKRKNRKELHKGVLSEESGASEAEAYVDPSLDPENLHARHQSILVVRREVQRLRPALRAVIRQCYGAECSLEESAKALDISLSTAKARLSRGKQKLRLYLQKRGFSDSKL